jgi:hypothetical protein
VSEEFSNGSSISSARRSLLKTAAECVARSHALAFLSFLLHLFVDTGRGTSALEKEDNEEKK